MGMRNKARQIAVQTLYSLVLTSKKDSYMTELEWKNDYPEKMNEIVLDSKIEADGKIAEFAENKIKDVIHNLEKIDELITKTSIKWTIERIAPLELSILRLSIGEFLATDIPVPVVINEALEVTDKFCIDNSKKFINGILDTVSKIYND